MSPTEPHRPVYGTHQHTNQYRTIYPDRHPATITTNSPTSIVLSKLRAIIIIISTSHLGRKRPSRPNMPRDGRVVRGGRHRGMPEGGRDDGCHRRRRIVRAKCWRDGLGGSTRRRCPGNPRARNATDDNYDYDGDATDASSSFVAVAKGAVAFR
jgi:hypothetical protein